MSSDYHTRSTRAEIAEQVRERLDARLDRNLGDTVVCNAGAIADASGDMNSHVVGNVLRRLAAGEVESGGLDVSVWSRRSGGETRWLVQRDDGGGE